MASQLKMIRNKANPIAFLDIFIKNQDKGSLLFELFEDVTPKTAGNFKQLCIGDQVKDGIQLKFKESIFHRIIPGFMCQGGDFTKRNGTGGYSIYGRTFPDENFTLKHEAPGALSMANAGKNTNGSQFFITLAPCPWLNGKHTVFGQLIAGFRTLKEMESQGSESGTPLEQVKIGDCGILTYEQLDEVLKNLEKKK